MASKEMERQRFMAIGIVWEIIMIILYGTCVEYDDSLMPGSTGGKTVPEAGMGLRYGVFQDVHVMIFVGFGFLMTFLKRYGFSAVGFNFLISTLTIQWALLVIGFWHNVELEDFSHKISLKVESLIMGDFAAGAVMITFGALLGKVSPAQMFAIMICEVFFYALNEMIAVYKFHMIDVGGSMIIHAFGAYFGLACSRVLARKPARGNSKNGSTVNSDLFAMIGTIFLWMFWPSFNGALANPIAQHRAVVNTVLSLTASCVMAYFVDGLLRKKSKFDMVSIQNATLAGGVAVGSTADLVIHPWAPLVIGAVAGAVSVVGYTKIQPFLERTIGLDDTCGVHNLHGMPGLIGGLASIIAAASAKDSDYNRETDTGRSIIGDTWAARAPKDAQGYDGKGWTAGEQAQHQLYTLLVTLTIAIVGGALTGFIVKLAGTTDPDSWYDDAESWHTPDDEASESQVNLRLSGRPAQPLQPLTLSKVKVHAEA